MNEFAFITKFAISTFIKSTNLCLLFVFSSIIIFLLLLTFIMFFTLVLCRIIFLFVKKRLWYLNRIGIIKWLIREWFSIQWSIPGNNPLKFLFCEFHCFFKQFFGINRETFSN